MARVANDWYALRPGATSATVRSPNGVASRTATASSPAGRAVTATYARPARHRVTASTSTTGSSSSHAAASWAVGVQRNQSNDATISGGVAEPRIANGPRPVARSAATSTVRPHGANSTPSTDTDACTAVPSLVRRSQKVSPRPAGGTTESKPVLRSVPFWRQMNSTRGPSDPCTRSSFA
ncbi:Uncharacterised protein [Mycobacteroides abscessus]|nr:Uncharacterised protein [Mycobacteroides abscessus]